MVMQHRLVIECHLNRFLTGIEVVHHEDENMENNLIENLSLFENQAAHMRYHHEKAAKLYDPATVEMVRNAAADPTVRIKGLSIAPSTVDRICKRYNIRWISDIEKNLPEDEVYKVLQKYQRKEAVKILGVSLQWLWNRHPGLMRKTASRKLKKRDAQPGAPDIQTE